MFQLLVLLYIIFHQKLYIKYGGETIPRPFSTKSKLSMALDK